jgi:hypothetical protein
VKRLEVIANQSVRVEFVEAMEAAAPKIEYSIVPLVQGRGARKRKEGNRTWPETNFLFLCYAEDSQIAALVEVVAGIKRRFPEEGIFAATSEARAIG